MRMAMRMQEFNQWLLSDVLTLALRHAAKPGYMDSPCGQATPFDFEAV